MTTTEQLRKLVIENPESEIVTMTHYEVCASDDWTYWLGHAFEVELTNLFTYDERVYSEKDLEDLEEKIYEILDDEDSSIADLPESKQVKLMEERMNQMIEDKKIEVKEKVICIYIGL